MDLVQTQIAYFFENDYLGQFEAFSIMVKAAFVGQTTTTQLPLDDSVPSEVPRIMISYDGAQINISKARIDLMISDQSKSDKYIDLLNCMEYEKLGINIARVAYIRTYFASEYNVETLRSTLSPKLRELPVREINIRINREYTFNDIPCNDIEKIDIGSAQKITPSGPISVDGLVIQKDVNSSEKMKTPINRENRMRMLKAFGEKTKELYIIGG